jgi:multiple sugar transport system permease protein
MRALGDPLFSQALAITAVWIAGVVGLQLALGLAFALALNEGARWQGALRGLVLVPWATPSVICAFIFMWLLDGNHGVVNAVLLKLGVVSAPVQWLSTPGLSLWAAILALVWHGVPFFAVMLLAGLQTIADEYYEAAEIDGAGAWARFRHVTLPLLLPTALVTVLLRVIWTANHVEIPLVMTQGGPANSATTLAILTIVTARGRLDYGYAASLSMWLAAFLSVVAVGYLRHRARRTAP